MTYICYPILILCLESVESYDNSTRENHDSGEAPEENNVSHDHADDECTEESVKPECSEDINTSVKCFFKEELGIQNILYPV